MSGIKKGLHARPLTQGEWNQLFHGDEWERHPTHCITSLEVARIRATIDNGGFAPEQPTDDEVNTTIAKAQGWVRRESEVRATDNKNEWNEWPRRWVLNDGSFIRYDNYQPVSNLGQALEAAAALKVMVEIGSVVDGSRCCFIRRMPSTTSPAVYCDSAADAARAISLHLYARIKEQDAET